MKAVRWILFCLLAFGLGTGVALAVNPPTVGVPSETASQLSGDLAAVKQYASEGRCTAVRARLDGAQSRISKLPASTNTSVVTELQDALGRVSTAATTACQQVADAELAAEQKRQAAADRAAAEAEATTPTETTPTQTTPSVGGDDDGGPDPGTGEGDTDTGTPQPSTPADGAQPGPDGGATIPDTLEQKVEEARKRWKDRIDRAQDQWNRALGQ